MGDHKVTPLWDGNPESSEPPLRRPNRSSTPNQINNTNSQSVQDSRQSLDLSVSFNNSVSLEDDIVSKSNLSVDAKEWFPPNYSKSMTPDSSNSSGSKSVQNRLHKYKRPDVQIGENHMEEFFQQPPDGVGFDETSKDLSKLQVIICTLIEDPGQFDDLIGTFIETLGPYYEDVNIVSTTTNLIFSQALMEPNFRYNAARLCSTIEEQCPLFRSALHLLCEQKIKENPYDANLTLFLAELYAQLNYDNLYGKFVIQTLQCVLSLGDASNVKAVCQVLKLTGSSLDTYNKAAINEVFKQLDVVKQVQPSNVVNLINSVVTLRASNWGQGETSPTATNNRYQGEDSPAPHDGPIFYGPDGKELTDEERQFLADSCSYQDFMNDDSDPEGLWDPDPEMDEEMQAAFRQFIQLSK